MGDMAADIGRRALAIAILIGVAYLALKVVIGLVTGLVWIVIAVIAVVAALWAVKTL